MTISTAYCRSIHRLPNFEHRSILFLMNLQSFSCLAIAAAGLTVLAGCAEKGPKTVPVYGTVSFIGREVPTWCHIYFTPMKTDTMVRPTFAERQPNGSYNAKSFSTSRGLLPGTYRVRVN